jgi:phosphoribosylaminoimidazolecarboxamide formyltransferase/IMP cyclohydrolase
VEEKDLSRQEISRVLISVSDKSGIKVYSKSLSEKGIEIISTGGTSRAISEAGVVVRP